MADFRLPPNSRIRKGTTHRAPAGARKVRRFRIYRFDPTSGETPRADTFELDVASCGPMVLDALIQIKGSIDSSLTFRRSCREGICGSCAMNIDGLNCLACTTALEDLGGGEVRIYPLPVCLRRAGQHPAAHHRLGGMACHHQRCRPLAGYAHVR